MSTVKELAKDVPIAAVAGYLGTKAMEPVAQKLYEWESQADREREEAVRPGPPFQVAAAKALRLVGVEPEERTIERLGLAFHYGLAIGWAPTYALLRRRTSLGPLNAGLVSGAAMWLVADEGMTPALGFSAPNRAYPLSTHVRALISHLVFGVAVGAVTETAWRLSGPSAA